MVQGVASPGCMGTFQQSQTIEFYDANGRHVGYGKVYGGTVEFFNLNLRPLTTPVAPSRAR